MSCPPAVKSRVMQFEAGPERTRFYACQEHARILESGDVTCFYATKSNPIEDVDPEEDVRCNFCEP